MDKNLSNENKDKKKNDSVEEFMEVYNQIEEERQLLANQVIIEEYKKQLKNEDS